MQNKFENCGLIYNVFRKPIGGKGIFKCEICGKEYMKLYKSHFKQHGLTIEEYFKLYPEKNINFRNQYISNLIYEKVEEFYIHNNRRALCFNTKTNEYYEDKVKGKKNFVAHRKHVINHFLGGGMYGIYFWKYYTKLLVFDIDAYNGCFAEAKTIAIRIKDFLTKNIPESNVYINSSGSKGYHVTIYFNKSYRIDKSTKLYNIVLKEIGAESFSNTIIEARPSGQNSKGIKLPLCVNYRNGNTASPDDNINFCYYYDDNMKIVEDEVNFFLNLKKTSITNVDALINNPQFSAGLNYIYKPKVTKLTKTPDTNNKTLESKVEVLNDYSDSVMQSYLDEGLKSQGTRHNISYLLALWLHGKDHSPDEIYNILHPWSLNQRSKGLSNSSTGEIERDLRNIVFKLKSSHVLFRKTSAVFNSDEMIYFRKINDMAKIQKKSMNTRKRVFFALMIQMKRYSDYGKDFFMSYEQIRDLSGVSSYQTINNAIADLESFGFLQINTRRIMNNANHYQINKLHSASVSPTHFEICQKKELCADCVLCAYQHFLGKNKLEMVSTGSELRKLKGNEFICENNKEKLDIA